MGYSFRSGQVRSESLMPTFRVSCLGHRLQPSPVPLFGTGKKGGKGMRRGLPALAGAREYQQSDWGQWQAEGVKMIWNLECPVG